MGKKENLIKKEEVEYLANLARISLTEGEKEHLAKELGKIIEYVSHLSEVEADRTPSAGDIPITNVFREDRVKNTTNPEEMLSVAPEKEDNFFKVPRII